MASIFKKTRFNVTPVGNLIEHLRHHIDGARAVSSNVARSALSLESIDNVQEQALNEAGNRLQVAIEAVAEEIGFASNLTEAQVQAAAIAGILAGDYRNTMSRKMENAVATESMAVINAVGSDVVNQRAFGLEAYDERENRDAVIYSIAYNMQSARQDEFGETHFPTITLTPDQVGFGVTVDLMMVFDGAEHKITGTFEDFKKKNIIRAVTDSTILRKDQTRVVPVYRAQSADKFIASTIVAPQVIDHEGVSINTAPLATGKKLDLIALGQHDQLIQAGVMDQTDTLDPYLNLQDVYVKVGNDVLKFNVLNLPLANFVYSPQNNYRIMTLNFHTTSILVNVKTKQVDGSDLDTLASIATNDLIVRLEVSLTGTINIETGETQVFGNAVGVYSVQDSSGQALALDAAPAKAIVDAFAAATIPGWYPQAYYTNMNRRQRGQFIDVTKYTQLYNVPLRSPITTIHPINVDGQTDASDVQALITTTRIRTSNEAVTALINAAAQLREYVDSRDMVGVGPDMLGVGRFFVRPTYFEESIDMNDIVDSIKSHERAVDIQAALVNKLRDYAYRMFRDSEYKAASDALSGGISPVPTVIIGTDPVIARYLMVTGELRTLGGEFNVRLVSTLDKRVTGKIFVTFGVFDEGRNVSPNPLNFGNMAWAPELVLTANISRGNTISKETVVQPRYTFVVNCPVMTCLNISNIPDVVGKVPVRFQNV